jgi:uncharacterized protein YjbI with pentapeptide repeats
MASSTRGAEALAGQRRADGEKERKADPQEPHDDSLTDVPGRRLTQVKAGAAGRRIMRGMRALTLAALFVLAAPGAYPACSDAPGAGVDWSGCRKQSLVIRKKNLQGASFEHATLIGVNFERSDLSRASFAAAEVSRTSFRDAILERANLSKVIAVRSTFAGARLAGADLEKAELHRCILTGAALPGADLSKGDFGRSVFDRADLRDASFRYASLARASLREAKLAGADFSQAHLFAAHLEGTDLSEVKGLVQAQLDIACGDARTRLPPGLSAPSGWPCDVD